jgi:hypothetical protein
MKKPKKKEDGWEISRSLARYSGAEGNIFGYSSRICRICGEWVRDYNINKYNICDDCYSKNNIELVFELKLNNK